MSGKQLIIDYFASSLLTNSLSFENFKELVSRDEESNEPRHYSDEELMQFYSYFRQIDEKRMLVLREMVEKLYRQISHFELNDFGDLLTKQSHYTFQDFVFGLNEIDRLLQTRFLALNDSIREGTERLRNFNGLIQHADPESGLSVLDSINKTVRELQRYKQILQVAIDGEEEDEKEKEEEEKEKEEEEKEKEEEEEKEETTLTYG